MDTDTAQLSTESLVGLWDSLHFTSFINQMIFNIIHILVSCSTFLLLPSFFYSIRIYISKKHKNMNMTENLYLTTHNIERI